ncbi:hypothetical protein BDN72DRAFT_816596 [Pluteus cervinus]|uniref:Uncharacterized protein n=1 Tax=Pluteus cervinus TaxID=181527 RepID=A0ACD3B1U9_9AGAR|nr:hypothetical protein BDN72DRAFT_816596 [Pluteus cervinus]
MRFLSTFTALLTGFSLVNAQYFSEGWKPGQAVTENPPEPSFVASTESGNASPQNPIPTQPLDFTAKILGSKPVAALFARVGINITERLAQQSVLPWDERIPLITDDNFADLIENEQLSQEEAEQRVWMLVITAAAARQDGMSKYADEVFDAAYNETQIEGDLPNVRWGRIDYLNVTMITTKWSVWHAPYLVVLTDRGKTLRFYRAQNIRLRSDALREFLKHDTWKQTPHWESAYAPGGEREYVLAYLAIALTKIYNVFVLVPRWMLFLFSGTLGSFIIGLLHRTPKEAKAAPAEGNIDASSPQAVEGKTAAKPAAQPTATTTARGSTPQPGKRSPTKRKGRK